MMISNALFARLAVGFSEVERLPHFSKQSFRVNGSIFATLDESIQQAVLKLSLLDQEVFSIEHPEAVIPVPGKWGKQGWTILELDYIDEVICTELLRLAYSEVAPAHLAEKYRHLL